MTVVAERVDRLEEALADFTTSVGIEFNKLYNVQIQTQKGLQRLQDEMREFKNEMQAFKEEMQAFKGEMHLFKDEVRADQEASRRERIEMNRKWGDLANKLGTMVEDLVYPSLARIVKERFDQEPRDLVVRFKRRLPDGRREEIDALAVTDELILLNSTKATLRSADVESFVQQIERFREFFPEYAALPVVGLLATLSVDDSVLRYAERSGFLVAAVGEEVMELKNRADFEPQRRV